MAMGGADETIKINFVVNSQQAVANAVAFRTQIDAIKAQLLDLSKSSGMALKDVAEGMKQATKAALTSTDPQTMLPKLDTAKYAAYNKALSQSLREATAETKALDAASKKASESLNKVSSTGGAISKLGGILRNAFSFFLGGSIFMAISRLISGFQNLIATGEEYAQTIYRLGVSINQLQRRGLDITIRSEIALIKELSAQYQTFSQKGVISALASVQMLTRNFGFSQEQIRKTTELSMDLALVQGKDVAETAKQLALFYSSGYGEGLQHAGLAVNRMTVANEAHRMGLEKTYMQLTEIERATAAYNLVTRQSIDLHEDAMKIQDSLIGQIRDQRSSIEDVTNEIALKALPIELAWLKVKLLLVQAIGDFITLDELYKKQLAKEGKMYIPFWPKDKEAWEKAKSELEKKTSEWEEILSGTLDVDADLNLDISGEDQGLADAREKLGQQIIDLWDDLQDAQEDFNDKSEELEEEHVDKLAEIDKEGVEKQSDIFKDYQRDMLEAQEDFQEKLEDIDKDLAREIEESRIDYNRKLEDIDRDYRRGVEDANRKYQENELKAERDYQEKLRRLREEFLFDLEDALRERDALQVLRLIRRYNLDKEQLERQGDLEAEDRAENYRRELEDLRRQAEEKRQDAQRELQQDISDAQAAAQRKREDAQQALADKLADLKESYERERADALAATQERRDDEAKDYADRQAELEKDLKDRKDKILAAFGEEVGITGTSLQEVSDLFTKYFGDKGVVPETIDIYISKITEAANSTSDNLVLMQGYLAQMAQSAADTVTSMNTSFSGIQWPAATGPSTPVPNYSGPSGEFNPQVPGFAFGGSVYANTPTMAMFGEVPEIATFTPLSRMNTSSMSPLGGGSEQGGNMKIQILLSPGLEAQIIDNSLGSMAEILQGALGVRL